MTIVIPNHKKLAMDVAALALTDPEPSVLQREALEAKQRITQAFLDVQRELWASVTFLDSLVNVNAPTDSWQWGWYQPASGNTPTVTPTPSPRSSSREVERKQRVLAIAQRLVTDGIVRTADIGAELAALGDRVPEKNLATAVGNILSRNGWKRVATGEYEPPDASPQARP